MKSSCRPVQGILGYSCSFSQYHPIKFQSAPMMIFCVIFLGCHRLCSGARLWLFGRSRLGGKMLQLVGQVAPGESLLPRPLSDSLFRGIRVEWIIFLSGEHTSLSRGGLEFGFCILISRVYAGVRSATSMVP